MQRSSVLLPPPDGPITAATSPRRTESDTPSSTRSGPWFLTRLRTSIIDSRMQCQGLMKQDQSSR